MSSERNYEVGYGKPPRSTQFKKGQSGNPKGRPIGSRNLSTALRQCLEEKVVVTENGARRRITMMDAMLKQVVRKAAAGDLKAFQQVVVLEQAGESQAFEEPAVVRMAEPKDVNKLLRRLAGSIRVEEESHGG